MGKRSDFEREKEYFEIAKKRISNYAPLTEFFE